MNYYTLTHEFVCIVCCCFLPCFIIRINVISCTFLTHFPVSHLHLITKTLPEVWNARLWTGNIGGGGELKRYLGFQTWYVLSKFLPLGLFEGTLLILLSSVLEEHFLELHLVKGGTEVTTLLSSLLLFSAWVLLNLLPRKRSYLPTTCTLPCWISSTLFSAMFGGGVGASCKNNAGMLTHPDPYSSPIMCKRLGLEQNFWMHLQRLKLLWYINIF